MIIEPFSHARTHEVVLRESISTETVSSLQLGKGFCVILWVLNDQLLNWSDINLCLQSFCTKRAIVRVQV
jgi:hypothetical protein